MGSGGSNAVVATAGHWYRGQQPVVSTEGSTSILICCPSSAAVPVWDVPVPSADRRRLHQLRGSSATARGWMYWMRPARGCRVSRVSLSLSAHIPAVSLQSHSTHARVIIEMVHISIRMYCTVPFVHSSRSSCSLCRQRGREDAPASYHALWETSTARRGGPGVVPLRGLQETRYTTDLGRGGRSPPPTSRLLGDFPQLLLGAARGVGDGGQPVAQAARGGVLRLARPAR
jgi:hypothetical protein